jgi:hypothetical protein
MFSQELPSPLLDKMSPIFPPSGNKEGTIEVPPFITSEAKVVGYKFSLERVSFNYTILAIF